MPSLFLKSKRSEQGWANWTCNKQIVNILGLADCEVVIAITQFCCLSAQVAIDNMQMTEHGYILIEVYEWLLKFGFNVIFMCYQIYSSLDIFNFSQLQNHLKGAL